MEGIKRSVGRKGIAAKFNLPWEYEDEHIDDVPIDGKTFVRPRLWGTKENGDPTLICEFAVPVNPYAVKLILAAGKLQSIAQVRGWLK